jgi:hypothetical protein
VPQDHAVRGRKVPGGRKTMLWSEFEAAAPGGNAVAWMVGQLGTVGSLVWFLWWMTSREMPRGRRDFLDALEKQRERYGALLTGQRDEMREFAESNRELARANQDLADAVREALELRRLRRAPTNPPPQP